MNLDRELEAARKILQEEADRAKAIPQSILLDNLSEINKAVELAGVEGQLKRLEDLGVVQTFQDIAKHDFEVTQPHQKLNKGCTVSLPNPRFIVAAGITYKPNFQKIEPWFVPEFNGTVLLDQNTKALVLNDKFEENDWMKKYALVDIQVSSLYIGVGLHRWGVWDGLDVVEALQVLCKYTLEAGKEQLVVFDPQKKGESGKKNITQIDKAQLRESLLAVYLQATQ